MLHSTEKVMNMFSTDNDSAIMSNMSKKLLIKKFLPFKTILSLLKERIHGIKLAVSFKNI